VSTTPLPRARMRRSGLIAVAGVATLLVATACGDDGDDDGGGEVTSLTMWTRAATATVTQAYADAYETATGITVEVTDFPNEEYPARLASAAGSQDLPDIFATDVVFSAQFAAEGLYIDITDRLAGFEFADQMAPAHVAAGTLEGRNYVVPHAIDMSIMLYNRELYEQAGLDPDQPPTSLTEFADHARTIREEVGGDVYGTYFGGNCGGCIEFTLWPSVWAAGGEVLSADGLEAQIDSPEMAEVFALYRQLYEEEVASPASTEEAGPTWLEALQGGTIGIAPGPGVWLGLIEEAGIEMGVAPITGIDGGESTFVGGDSAGISANSEHPDEAWAFLEWTMSEQAQLDVIAANKGVPTRTDLAENQYTEEDPRLAEINSWMALGKTPWAVNFNASFNDPQSPWTETLRGALFGDDPAQALADGNAAITEELQRGAG
jgi:multiple sugar transport system substrate-binding protein